MSRADSRRRGRGRGEPVDHSASSEEKEIRAHRVNNPGCKGGPKGEAVEVPADKPVEEEEKEVETPSRGITLTSEVVIFGYVCDKNEEGIRSLLHPI